MFFTCTTLLFFPNVHLEKKFLSVVTMSKKYALNFCIVHWRIFRKLLRLYFTSTPPSNHALKGQSNEIFYLQFFSSFKPAWATDQWVEIFLILVQFSPSYLNFLNLPGV